MLSDFPALVLFGTNIPGFDYSQLASPTGGDVRFTDATGTREIPHEIDEWNPSGTSLVWVQVPRLATTNDYIWAYWGNPAATTPPEWSTNGAVWVPQPFEGLPAYAMVYHLKEGAFPFLDSTTQHSATNGLAPGTTAGVVGTAGAFDGSDWLDTGTNDLGDAFTLSAWLNIPPGTVNIQTAWAEQHGGYGSPGFALFVNTYNNSDQIIDLATGNGNGGGAETKSAAGAFPFGAWHQLEAVINRTNGTVNFFVDGSSLGLLNGLVTDFPQTNDLRLGIFDDGNFGVHGGVDEARIQEGNSSANWIWADYMTMAQNASFEKYSSVSGAVTISAQLINGKLVLTWPSGTLLQAPTVTGPWTTNNAASPYTNTPSAPQEYYRVRVH